jgi:hypothetical protein
MNALRARGQTMLLRDRLAGSVVTDRAHASPDPGLVDSGVDLTAPQN